MRVGMKVISPFLFSGTIIRIIKKFTYIMGTSLKSQASTFGIATCYGPNGPGIEPKWGRDFLHPYRLVLGSTNPPVQWVPGPFPRGKAGRLPTPSITKIKEREELYLYSPSGPSGPVLEQIFKPFTLQSFTRFRLFFK